MNIFSKYSLLNTFLNKNKTVGLVPTMGSLHKGHLSLIERALNENEQVIVTIFINPTQFQHPDEINKYPKNLELDFQIIKTLSPKIIIYAPESKDLYKSSIASSLFNFGNIEKVMEGKVRPGHFQGVATVVEKLLNIFLPTRAYFGEKDFQQLQIIKSLVFQKDISTKIIGCPIVRESNGLALSSRNSMLSKQGRKKAFFIFQQLNRLKSLWGEEKSGKIIKQIEKSFFTNPHFKLDYIDIRFESSLLNAEKKSGKKTRAFIAAKLEKIRLIDNLALDEL